MEQKEFLLSPAQRVKEEGLLPVLKVVGSHSDPVHLPSSKCSVGAQEDAVNSLHRAAAVAVLEGEQ